VDCDRHTLSGYRLLAVRLPRPQHQLVVPREKSGRDHDELSQLIRDRSIMGLVVAQQFYSGAWRSRASDDRVTRAAMRWASSQILPVLSSFPSLFRLQKWTELNHPSAGGRGSGGLAMHRALIARWAALIAMLGLLALVIATSRIPCVPYGLWPTLQMHCR
jgi:hypothetical protein